MVDSHTISRQYSLSLRSRGSTLPTSTTASKSLQGRGSVISPAPIEWSARNPDLTTCDNSLWGDIKDVVSVTS